jgi:hypothetical protein
MRKRNGITTAGNKETVVYGTKEPTTRSKQRWFRASREEVSDALFSHARNIKDRQIKYRVNLKEYEILYGNFAGMYLTADHTTMPFIPSQAISLNVIKSAIDTWASRIAKNPPKATVLPSSGDDRLIKKATKLTDFLVGAAEMANLAPKREKSVLNAGIHGSSYILHYTEDNRLKARVIKADEALIEFTDSLYDDDEQLEWGYEHLYDKDEVIDRYPDFANEIENASRTWIGEQTYLADMNKVCVVERWRRNTFPGSNNGVHRKVIRGACLEYNDYHQDLLPIEYDFFTPPTSGPFGSGIAQALLGKQFQITYIMESICRAIHEYGVPRIFIPKSSGLSPNSISDEISIHLVNSTDGIQFSVPQPIANGVFEYLQWIYQSSFADIGLSQMSTQSIKPPGIVANSALQTLNERESERFALDSLRFERARLRGAKIQLLLATDLYEKKQNLSVKAPGWAYVQDINWKDASLDEDLYTLKMYPTSILSDDPAERLQQIIDLGNSKMMPPDVVIAQSQMPILRDWQEEMCASRDNINMCLSMIQDGKKYIAPDIIADVDLAVSKAQSAVLRAEYNEAPDSVIQDLRRWLKEALQNQALKQQQAQAQQQAQQPQPQQPQPQQPQPQQGQQ